MQEQSSSVDKIALNWVTGIVGIFNMLVLLPPILMNNGLEWLARYFYIALGAFCHQRADRSFYLFGEKLLYPKEFVLENVPFENVFTLNLPNRMMCSDSLGCKFGVCARCTGVYLGVLIGLLVARVVALYKIPKLIPILMIIPLVIDGTVQMVAYLISPENGFYESTNIRRFFTGLLFGLGMGYFIVSALTSPIAKIAKA